MLDKGGAVKRFVDALQQLTNPEMIFKVSTSIHTHTRPPPHRLRPLSLTVFSWPFVHQNRTGGII